MAVETLAAHGHDTARLRSKSWDEFAKPDAPEIDVIITVCDNAAGESCPIWPGRPLTAHWSLEDPAAVEGTRDRCRAAFEKTYELLAARIEALTRIDPEAADRSSRIAELASVGAPLIASKG